MNLIYLAKPTYGGWVSFTAHLCLKYKYKLFKIGKRTEILKNGEPRLRPFGYGIKYQNISIEDAQKLPNILITAIDKNYYQHLDKLPSNSKLVIHDPTEIKGKSCQPVIDVLAKFKIITIRKSVKKYLKNKYSINSEFKLHPFYEYPTTNKKKTTAESISRIDFDKHTDVILKTNKLLTKTKKIKVFGAKNDRYVYFKLKKEDLDFDKYYMGSFKKSFIELDKILHDAKFVVDLSSIKNDGGGSQYTFLEAIYQDRVLILSNKWLIDGPNNIFINKFNCLLVEDENDIFRIISGDASLNLDLDKINKNAKLLLKSHIKVKW